MSAPAHPDGAGSGWPAETASTAPPAEAPVPPRRPAGRRGRLRQVPYAIVVLGALTSLALTRDHAVGIRGGTLALGGILLVTAVARLVLPERRAGLLVTRRRLVDVPIIGLLGLSLLVAGLVLPPQP